MVELSFVRRALRGDSPEEVLERRFEEYYPRTFAYVLSNLGNPGRTRDLTTDAFASVLSLDPRVPDEQFRAALFSAASALCAQQARAIPLDFALSEPEREAITLLFDAQLGPAEAERLLGDRLQFHLYRALNKMRGEVNAADIPVYLRAAR
jgi:hypothetical protein